MKKFLRDYFTFNTRERNGILVLLTIIVALILFWWLQPMFVTGEVTDFTSFEKEIAAFQSAKNAHHDSIQHVEPIALLSETPVNKSLPGRFSFNPNNLPENEWKRLGLSARQIHTIKNYESKGGKFYKKEDLKKIYGIKEELYSSLEPYIVLVEKSKVENPKLVYASSTGKTSEIKLNLNTADSTELLTLKGIGPAYAKRIISYRTRLGGFVNKEQLFEIYGMDTLRYNSFTDRIIIDPENITHININTVTAETLKKHPYINKWNIANAIVNYRTHHGNYKSLEELKAVNLVSAELYTKLFPYFIID